MFTTRITTPKLLETHTFILILIVSGCTDIQVHQDKKNSIDLRGNEKISFILDRFSIKDIEDAQNMEEQIEECISNELNKLVPPVQIVSAETFRNTVFPGIDYLSVPSSLESVQTLLQTTSFKARIDQLEIRYLLILKNEYSSKAEPVGGCIGGGGGGACLAFIVWNNETKLSVTVVDVEKSCSVGEVKAQAIGHPWVGIVLIFPLGFPAFSEGPACNALAKEVAAFIAGDRQK